MFLLASPDVVAIRIFFSIVFEIVFLHFWCVDFAVIHLVTGFLGFFLLLPTTLFVFHLLLGFPHTKSTRSNSSGTLAHSSPFLYAPHPLGQ